MATSREWQLSGSAAERYADVLVPWILGPAARALVELTDLDGVGDGMVLDIGCGTGAAIGHARERATSGRCVGVDVNADMLRVARAGAAAAGHDVVYVEGTALDLPFDADQATVVLCAQTLQFLPEPLTALREMRRVLADGGSAMVSCWADVTDNPYFAALIAAVTKHVGADTAAGLAAAFGLADADRLRELALAAGFASAEVAEHPLELALPTPEEFVPRHVAATPMAAGFAAASSAARESVVGDVAAALTSYSRGDGVTVPFTTHVLRAR